MTFGSSFKVAGAVAAISGVLALVLYNAVRTDPECGKWGYVIRDASTCVKDVAVTGSQVFGLICGVCVLGMIRGILAARS